ncbi:Lrp/AsnC family transcriptional regulator [Streptomyces sp. NBC_01218]|uniref:Lrp/AsnC family transcriptional regulator n=1 Tax=unclassified Streptomyces TaxID=2593676 RepID=UPI0023B9E47A|nr:MULTISPECIES: Lrp/AsnC family transcriptional regulator [unclassified Streptomyces]WEH40236.1 Lrp/AsnC family transcriptional regulator [Streptomyces sp. AM 2-1-1]WSQ51934.1 Lrp/AsnC family transcriptional regulator [Streptomyces sp. NBC_01218]
MEPHLLDTLDLKLLQALELDGRTPFSRIAQVLGVSDQTVARRFRRLRATAGLRVVGMVDESRLGRTGWIVRLGCAHDAAPSLAAALARRPDTHYIDLVAGGAEVVCAIRPRSERERDELFLERIQRTPQVTSVTAHCVLHSYYGNTLGWLRKISALDAEEELALRTASPAPSSAAVVLDAADETMLTALARDGRAPLTELQTVTGQSEASVARRLDRLRSTGVLYFAVEYDHVPLGRGVEALCWLTVTPRDLVGAGRLVAGHPEVRFAGAVTGRTNLVVSVLCRTTADLYAFVGEKLAGLPGVVTAETTPTLRRVKTLTQPSAG